MTDNFPLFLQQILLPALKDTLYMVVTSTILASIIGFVLAIILFVTDKDGLRPNKYRSNNTFYKIYCWYKYRGNGSYCSTYYSISTVYCKDNWIST